MTIKLTFSILSFLLVIGTPIGFAVSIRKINGTKIGFWNLLIGIVLEFLCKDVLLRIIVAALSYIPFFADILTNPMFYGILTILITALTLLAGLLLVNKVYAHQKINVVQASGIALGASIADILMNYLMVSLSNLIYLYQMSNGTLYDSLLEVVSSESAKAVIELYNNFPTSYFLYIGMISAASLFSNFLIMMLLVRKTRKEPLSMVTLLGTILAVTAVYYVTNPLTMNYANIILGVAAIVFLVLGLVTYKINRENGD